jgi:hypothetical protein
MEKTLKGKKSRKVRLTRLAQALVRFTVPDEYFTQAEGLQPVDQPLQTGDYVCVVPEQIVALARVKNYPTFTHHSRP